MVDPLLHFMARASQYKLDNDLTYAGLINILSDLPNAQIELNMLDNVQVWLASNSDRMMATSAICSKLLPKFLQNKDANDSAKAEQILTHLLGISKSGVRIDHTIEIKDSSYFANAYPSILAEKLLTDKLIEPIAKYCSPFPFYGLARTLKILLLDFPQGMHLRLKTAEEHATVLIEVQLPDLILSLVEPENKRPQSSSLRTTRPWNASSCAKRSPTE